MEQQKTRQPELTNNTSRLPSENDLESSEKQSQNTFPIEKKGSKNKPNIEGRLLSGTDEAYQLAKTRGFKGKLDSFRSGINRSKTAQDYRMDYGIIKVGQRNEAKYYDVAEAD